MYVWVYECLHVCMHVGIYIYHKSAYRSGDINLLARENDNEREKKEKNKRRLEFISRTSPEFTNSPPDSTVPQTTC